MSEHESWCLMAFCPRKGPVRGDPKHGIRICEPHWKAIHEGDARAQELSDLTNDLMDAERKIENVLPIIKEITERKGAFNRDPHTHCKNAVDSMEKLARKALTTLEVKT